MISQLGSLEGIFSWSLPLCYCIDYLIASAPQGDHWQSEPELSSLVLNCRHFDLSSHFRAEVLANWKTYLGSYTNKNMKNSYIFSGFDSAS